MPSPDDINDVISFLYINVDFFAAPFTQPDKYQKWAGNNRRAITPLSNALKEALSGDTAYGTCLSEYRLVLTKEKAGLIHGKDTELLRFLRSAEADSLVVAVKKHMNDPIIARWYENQATPEERERRTLRIALEKNTGTLVNNYNATVGYQTHLEEELKKKMPTVVAKKELFKSLCNILKLPNNEQISTDQLSEKLMTDYCFMTDADRLLTQTALSHKPLLILALDKYRIITNARCVLTRPGFLQSRMDDFYEHLSKNKDTLTKRRDDAFITFAKVLGVAAAAVFGVGVGGYFVHQRFFGAKATQGHDYIDSIAKIDKSSKTPER